MKKALFYLVLGLGLFSILQTVKAESEQFYKAEVVPGIFLALERPGKIFYQEGFVLRRKSDQQFSYCIAPFRLLREEGVYESNNAPEDLSKDTWKKISALAYFGYGYKEHTESKWYFVTQIMIWRVIEPDRSFYFTDELEGARVEPFQEEEQELQKLVDDYFKDPIWNRESFTGVVGETMIIPDPTNTTHYYQYENQDKNNNIIDDQLTIKIEQTGEKVIQLKRKETEYPMPPFVYYSKESQEMMVVGALDTKYAMLVVKGVENEIIIQKQDSETRKNIPQGNALLEGAIFGIFQKDNDMQVATITIGKDGLGSYKNLPFGDYYIKELKPGTGYQINEKHYDIFLENRTLTVKLPIENEVIKQKIEIFKKKEDSNKQQSLEAGVEFHIYDTQNNYIATLTTDELGYASIELPYGAYYLKQHTTTEGFQKVEDIFFAIDGKEKSLQFSLIDEAIPVPNTNSFLYFPKGMWFYVKKRYSL